MAVQYYFAQPGPSRSALCVAAHYPHTRSYGCVLDAHGQVVGYRNLPGPGGAGGAAAAGRTQGAPDGPKIESNQKLSVMVTERQAKEAQKEQVAVENRIKYLDQQNARVLRDLRAVHRSAEKLDCGRRRVMDRRYNDMTVRAERERERQEKADRIKKSRAVNQFKRKMLEQEKYHRLVSFQQDRDRIKNEAKDKLYGAEDKMKALEAEERLCVERLTYSKMVSQRVLEQLECTLGSSPRNPGGFRTEETPQLRGNEFFLDDKPQFQPPARVQPVVAMVVPEVAAAAGAQSLLRQSQVNGPPAQVVQVGGATMFESPRQAPGAPPKPSLRMLPPQPR